jgi:hypothetical protein
VAEALGAKPALGLYHDYSGYILFTAAIISMVVVGMILNMNFKEVWIKWKSALFNPT